MGKRKKNRPERLRRRSALTLLELVVVIAILAALAGMAVPLYENTTTQSQYAATNESLRRLQTLILNTYVPNMKGAPLPVDSSGFAFNPDGLPRGTHSDPPKLKYLFGDPNFGTTLAGFNYATRLGWNGPYLNGGMGTYPGLNPNAATNGFTTLFGTPTGSGYAGDPTVLDGWGNPIVIVLVNDQTDGQTYYVLLSAGLNQTIDSSITTANGAAVAATVTAATNNSPRLLNIGSSVYYHWLPLQ